MQNASDLPALLYNPRNIYIGIAALTLLVGLGPAGTRMPAYLGVMGLVAWLLWLSLQGKTPRRFPVERVVGVVADITPFPTARAFTISKYPNSGTVDGAMRITVGFQYLYMKCVAPLKVGDAVVVACIPNEAKAGPCAGVPFEVLALRDDSRSDTEGRYLKIPDARMQVPSGTRLWVLMGISLLLIGFLFPIYFIAIVKRSYDVKFGWQRAIAQAERLVGARDGAGAPADTLAASLLA